MDLYVSCSQVNTGVRCLRKWGIEKIDGISGPAGDSANAGTRGHEILEDWLGKAKPVDSNEVFHGEKRDFQIGLAALNGMHHLPPPGPHMMIEREFRLGDWYGRLDWAYKSVEATPVIGDHKFTGNLAYAHDENSLRTDTQAVVYAKVVLEEMPHAPHADLAWNYFGLNKPFPARAVRIRLTREYVDSVFPIFDRFGKALIRLRTLPGLKAHDLPPNPKACEDFGGCPHRIYCNLPSDVQLGAYDIMNTNPTPAQNPDFLSMIAQATQQANGVQPSAPSEWQVHPQSAAHEWNTRTGELRERVVAPPPIPVVAPSIPSVPVVPSIPAVPSAAPEIVHGYPIDAWKAMTSEQQTAVIAAHNASASSAPGLPPIVQADGVPPGTVNAPEGAHLAPRPAPIPEAPEAPAAAKPRVGRPPKVKPEADDLEALGKEQLVELARSLGLDTARLQEKGLREKIRAARKSGVVASAAPVAPSIPSVPVATPFAGIADASLEPGDVGDGEDDAEAASEIEAATGGVGAVARERVDGACIHRDRITFVVAALIQKGELDDDSIGAEGLVTWAAKIVDLIEKR